MWVSFSTSLSKHKVHIENPKFLTPGGGEKVVVVIVIVVVVVVVVVVRIGPHHFVWEFQIQSLELLNGKFRTRIYSWSMLSISENIS